MEVVILTDYFRSPTITDNRIISELTRLCSSDSRDQSNLARMLHL